MADEPGPTTSHDIIIRFTEVLEQHTNVIRHLTDVNRASLRASKSIGGYEKSLGNLRKAADKMYQAGYRLGNILRKSIAATAGLAGLALGSMVKSVQKASGIFHKLELSSMNAGRAMNQLREVYAGLQEDSANTISSMQDLADSLTQFQTNISRRALAANKQVEQGLV